MLTEAEKTAGLRFQGQMRSELHLLFETASPDHVMLPYIAVFRHHCAARMNRSTSLEMPEVYITSPAYEDLCVPEGRFAFIWREGRCRLCGETAWTQPGRLVDAYERPPLRGRVTRS